MESSSMVPADKQSSVADASSSSEDDALSYATRTLAKEAYVLFQSGKHADCLNVLNLLLQQKSDDPKILHNIAIAENIQDGFSNPKRFLEVLSNLKKHIETLADSSADQIPTANRSEGVVDGLDASIITFNIAVILYHLHEYHKCFAILEQLYQNIQQIDKTVARQICVLLLDVALICRRVSRAADVINYLETAGGNSLAEKSAPPINATVPDLVNTVNPRNSRPLNVKLHLYKARVLLLTRNLKAAKCEVKIATKDCCPSLFLKSQFAYARSNHKKAINLMVESSTQNDTVNLSLCYNNLGCIHYQLGHFQMSSRFFWKALRICSNLRKESPRKLLSFSQDKSTFFMYNCGLVYLASKKPLLAVRCFQKVGSVFFKQPVFWVRIAECCIMASRKISDIDVNVVGTGKWRRLVIGSLNLRKFCENDSNLSLIYAKNCLVNALCLLDGSSIDERRMTWQAALADLAFVYLELGNAVKALAAAKRLLKLPECSRLYVFFGNIYAAEAYCHLNRPKQASEHLSCYVSGELPYSGEDSGELSRSGLFFLEPERARGHLLADIAAMAAVQGDIKRAHEAAAMALAAMPDSPEVVLTATYIDLVGGKTQEAISKLKQYSRVRFPGGTLTGTTF